MTAPARSRTKPAAAPTRAELNIKGSPREVVQAVERMAGAAVLTSSASSEWRTPAWLCELLKKRYGPFHLDPAAAPGTSVGRRSFDRHDGGLEHPWEGRVYCNPPHARDLGESVVPWIEKALEELDAGNAQLVVMLVPSKTDTLWWHDLVMLRAWDIRFFRGRLYFEGRETKNSDTVPRALLVFRRRRRPGGPKYTAISAPSNARGVAKSEVTS